MNRAGASAVLAITAVVAVIPRLRINYEIRASHVRNPVAMDINYEKLVVERDQGNGIPLPSDQVTVGDGRPKSMPAV